MIPLSKILILQVLLLKSSYSKFLDVPIRGLNPLKHIQQIPLVLPWLTTPASPASHQKSQVQPLPPRRFAWLCPARSYKNLAQPGDQRQRKMAPPEDGVAKLRIKQMRTIHHIYIITYIYICYIRLYICYIYIYIIYLYLYIYIIICSSKWNISINIPKYRIYI